MRWSTLIALGGGAALVLSVVWLYNWLTSPRLSLEEVHSTYAEVQSRYEEIDRVDGSDDDWEAFESLTQERLTPVVDDLERAMPTELLEVRLYYQVGKYDIPKTIRARAAWEIPRMEQAHQLWTWRANESEGDEPAWSLDPVVVAMGLVDVGIIVWMFRLTRRWRCETRLRYLDRKFANHPDSVPYRGHRARLRAALGDREGALADINWLMERAPPGVDMKGLHALRSSLGG